MAVTPTIDGTMQYKNHCLYIAAVPIGNLSDITYRAMQLLYHADIIVSEDTRMTDKLLKIYFADQAPKKQFVVYNKDNATLQQHQYILKILQNPNKIVAMVCDAGTPCISDPGNTLIQFLYDNEIEVDFLPGPCALINGLVLSGLDTSKFVFMGFVPKYDEEKRQFFEFIAQKPGFTYIMYETSNRLANTLDCAYKTLGDCEACIARELTKLHQQVIRNKLIKLKTVEVSGEIVLLIEYLSPNQDENLDIPRLMQERTQHLIGQSKSTKDIACILSAEFNISRNRAYKFVCTVMAS